MTLKKEIIIFISIMIALISVFSFLMFYDSGGPTYTTGLSIYGDFDYSKNDTIYFIPHTGFSATTFSDGETWYDGGYYHPERQYVPSYTIKGYNFSLLNQSAKCVNIFIYENYSDSEWHYDFYGVLLTYYDKPPEMYLEEELLEGY